jgi:hypothetical protein
MPLMETMERPSWTGHSSTEEGGWVQTGIFDGRFAEIIERKLDEIAELQHNWDCYGAPAINPHIIDCARAWANRLPRELWKTPTVVPLSTGSVQFEWGDAERALELEFETPETIHYLKWDREAGLEEEGTFDADEMDLAIPLLRWFITDTAHA